MLLATGDSNIGGCLLALAIMVYGAKKLVGAVPDSVKKAAQDAVRRGIEKRTK